VNHWRHFKSSGVRKGSEKPVSQTLDRTGFRSKDVAMRRQSPSALDPVGRKPLALSTIPTRVMLLLPLIIRELGTLLSRWCIHFDVVGRPGKLTRDGLISSPRNTADTADKYCKIIVILSTVSPAFSLFNFFVVDRLLAPVVRRENVGKYTQESKFLPSYFFLDRHILKSQYLPKLFLLNGQTHSGIQIPSQVISREQCFWGRTSRR